MDSGFWTSQNALLGNQFAVDTVSNNIANINTVGFKSSTTNFEDVLYQTISGGSASTNPIQVGLGAQIASNSLNFSQGSIQPTNIATNLAINGNGFFILQHGPASNPNYYFTRAGNFSFDGSGNLVDPNGNFVVGWLSSPSSTGTGFSLNTNPQTGVPTSAVSPINISGFQKVPATASTYIKMQANLDSSNTVNEYSPASDTSVNFNVLFDSNGDSLNIQDGDSFQISYDGGKTWHTYEYLSPNSTTTPLSGAATFTSIADLLNKMQNDLPQGATLSFTNGQFVISNPQSATSNINIQVRPTNQDPSFTDAPDNQKLDTVMQALNQIIPPGQSASTQTFNVATHTINAFFYDSTGQKHNLNITFTKIAPNQWSWQATLPNNDGSVQNGSGIINFDSNGGLATNTQSPTITITSLTNGAPNVNLLLNFWNTNNGTYQGNQFTGITQFALNSNTTFLTQDGSPSGVLQSVYFNNNGDLIGSYTNGNSYTLAKVAIANFTNPQGLSQIGSNLYQITANTDTPQNIASKAYIGVAGQGPRGTIVPSSLEQSNVDLGTQLTNMIVYERSFQANSKSIQTIDQMIQTAIQLKQ
ncbi:flagellar hook protein FlgE [Desulfurella multipotens]|uniref:Flagellar hook protein FlgE n=1 Tax=Desulfurella multipotens TaxID=79269 RepID=A0A1G6M562_9BACT|nr:flagellar hook-basal body complex protein [Desulfurella multipotens]SDC50497.1 flagellar hook protein FlgE [Desulfurella multipotens]